MIGGVAAALVVVVGGALAVWQPWRDRPGVAERPAPPTIPVRADSAPVAQPIVPDSLRQQAVQQQTPPPAPAPPPAPVVREVRILGAPPTVPMGDTVSLQAVVLDQQGRLMGRRPQWTSSNPAVAQVGADGHLHGLTPGQATITASADGRRAQTDITVTAIVAALDVTPATAGLQVGQALVLVGTAHAADGRALPDRSVTWHSSNEAVVVVSTTGHVTAVGAGTAVVSATSEGQVGSAEITVAAPPAAQRETPPAPAPPPVVAEDPSAAIGEVVRGYAEALQARDMARVKALYPEIPSTSEQQTREAIQAMAELRVSLAATNIAVSGTTARARVTGAWVYKGGRLDVNNIYRFERRSDKWVIVGIN